MLTPDDATCYKENQFQLPNMYTKYITKTLHYSPTTAQINCNIAFTFPKYLQYIPTGFLGIKTCFHVHQS